jgi:hypothetical protein
MAVVSPTPQYEKGTVASCGSQAHQHNLFLMQDPLRNERNKAGTL